MGKSILDRHKNLDSKLYQLSTDYEKEKQRNIARRKNRKYYQKNRERLKRKNLENYYRKKREQRYEKIMDSDFNYSDDVNNGA